MYLLYPLCWAEECFLLILTICFVLIHFQALTTRACQRWAGLRSWCSQLWELSDAAVFIDNLQTRSTLFGWGGLFPLRVILWRCPKCMRHDGRWKPPFLPSFWVVTFVFLGAQQKASHRCSDTYVIQKVFWIHPQLFPFFSKQGTTALRGVIIKNIFLKEYKWEKKKGKSYWKKEVKVHNHTLAFPWGCLINYCLLLPLHFCSRCSFVSSRQDRYLSGNLCARD